VISVASGTKINIEYELKDGQDVIKVENTETSLALPLIDAIKANPKITVDQLRTLAASIFVTDEVTNVTVRVKTQTGKK
jgi:hypothetical protein